ncbi:hypothetical protein D3C73_484650 [compost metagenome]
MMDDIILVWNIQKEGGIHGIHFKAIILADDNAAIENIIGIGRDITKAKFIVIAGIR